MITYLVAPLLALTAAFAAQSVGEVTLTLTQQYARALYRDCRLDVTVFLGQGRIALHCALSSEPSKSLHADRTLTPDEVKAVSALVAASDLCGGGHTGRDERAGDGELETLQTNCLDGNVAVLVTSGNPTFTAQGARRQLIGRLYAMEDELRKSAAPPK
jgi:hypothetical protein